MLGSIEGCAIVCQGKGQSMMLRVFVFWCYSLVVAGCLRVTISDETVEKARLAFLKPISAVVSPFASKRSSIVD